MAFRSTFPLLRMFALLAVGTIASPTLAEMAAPPAAKQEYEISITGTVEIAPDGSISHYALDNSQALPLVKKVLENNIQRWRFQPIVTDGKPSGARTAIQVDITAEPIANGDHQMRLRNVSFGIPVYGTRRGAPSYPTTAAANSVGARVMLVLKLTPKGKVEIAHAQQVSLTHRTASEAIADSWRKLFVAASIKAAKGWRFDTAPEFKDQPMPEAVIVPVVFTMAKDKDKWQAFVPGPITPPDWLRNRQLALSDQQIADGEARGADGRVHLLDGFVGQLL